MIFYLFLDELTLHIDSTQRELKKVTATKQVCSKCLCFKYCFNFHFYHIWYDISSCPYRILWSMKTSLNLRLKGF